MLIKRKQLYSINSPYIFRLFCQGRSFAHSYNDLKLPEKDLKQINELT